MRGKRTKRTKFCARDCCCLGVSQYRGRSRGSSGGGSSSGDCVVVVRCACLWRGYTRPRWQPVMCRQTMTNICLLAGVPKRWIVLISGREGKSQKRRGDNRLNKEANCCKSHGCDDVQDSIWWCHCQSENMKRCVYSSICLIAICANNKLISFVEIN